MIRLLILFTLFFSALSSTENSLSHRDLISIEDLSKEELELVIKRAKSFAAKREPELLKGYVLASCFFEPSTRTRLSFESAMHRLGGRVIGFTDASTTSTKKGESLSDMMQGIGGFADIIVIRHPEVGSAHLVASLVDVPVINGGDGFNQHPTQTLVDLYSIKECQGKIDGLHIAIAGDLKYGRTVHSLCQALSHYSVRLYFISPDFLTLPEKICRLLQERGISYSFHESIEEVVPLADILYMTRIQRERFVNEPPDFENHCLLKLEHLAKAKENLRILHPLPRQEEVETAIDNTPYAYYFKQMGHGVPVRMAILALLLKR